MTKVRTFSRVFPSYHPRAGEPTYFVEKILNSLGSPKDWSQFADHLSQIKEYLNFDVNDCKHHTIRAGHHFKPGDWFSPRVWSGVPYKSKQIIIAPDIQVKKVWDIRIDLTDQYEVIYLMENGCSREVDEKLLALNDGLTEEDFYYWFDTPQNRKEIFKGQIISWSDSVNY